jgi:CysZ protein
MIEFMRGFSYVPRGFRLLGAPGLRRFVIVPILVNVLVFIGLFWLGAESFQDLLNWIFPEPAANENAGWWGQTVGVILVVLQWLLWPLFLLASVVLIFYLFTIVANLIAAPFNGMLSARVEQRVTGRLPQGVPEGPGIVLEAAGSVLAELRKLAYFVTLAVPALLLFFIPVANIAAPVVWAVVGAWILALEYADYPLSNRGIAFSEQRTLVKARRARHMGFGLGVLAMTLIPGLNLLAMPTAVIGGTLLICDVRER